MHFTIQVNFVQVCEEQSTHPYEVWIGQVYLHLTCLNYWKIMLDDVSFFFDFIYLVIFILLTGTIFAFDINL